MGGLRPFFPYYGSKWLAARAYPPPVYSTIVEPFAGSAGYATRYPDRNVVLVEREPHVAAIWRWLISVSEDEILSLPLVPEGESVDSVGLQGAARWFVGFHLNTGHTVPARQRSTWRSGQYAHKGWHEGIRKRTADQLHRIRHWRVIDGDYTESSSLVPGTATWFIDPPYHSKAGRSYRTPPLDYQALSRWAQERHGQVIVCETAGANWLPFQTVWHTKGSTKRSQEAVWVQYR